MEIIAHRINTLEELKKLPRDYGAEIDIRDYGSRLILQHDPFQDGEDLEPFLQAFVHGTLILNIKSERIEFKVQELLNRHCIRDYFFLDSSFPMIRQLSHEGESKIAVRYSELESMDTILNLRGYVDWVWVDSFERLVMTAQEASVLKDAGFKLCLVSPDLQRREGEISRYKEYCAHHNLSFDAVCVKVHNADEWQ